MKDPFLYGTLSCLLESIYALPREPPLIPSFFPISSSLLSVMPKYAKKDYIREGNPNPVFFNLILSSLRFSFEPKIIILQKTVQKSLRFIAAIGCSFLRLPERLESGGPQLTVETEVNGDAKSTNE
jgi:hypothetical protein